MLSAFLILLCGYQIAFSRVKRSVFNAAESFLNVDIFVGEDLLCVGGYCLLCLTVQSAGSNL